MAYFSRLTDIVTCNLSSILSGKTDVEKALNEILAEMREGVGGAERCVRTAIANVIRMESEIANHRLEVSTWVVRAQDRLKQGQDDIARECLERKHEIEDLIGGLEQQLQSAIGTRDHLQTMLNALQARVAEATRKLKETRGEATFSNESSKPHDGVSDAPVVIPKLNRVDSELEELRRMMNQS